MKGLSIALLCIALPLVQIGIMAWLPAAFMRNTGFARLAALYPARGRMPANTRVRSFSVNLLSIGLGGSAGADHRGVYVYGGYEGTESFIPWDELETVALIANAAVFRERQTRLYLTVAREFARFKSGN